MGNLIRRYWIPMLASTELPPSGRVKRVQLLGERLIAYRTPGGTPSAVAEFCPHRGASLYYGRVEATGIRCVYHGWKYGLDGQCVEMPNEPAESSFAAKVCQAAYPCVDHGGVIWAYLGPAGGAVAGRAGMDYPHRDALFPDSVKVLMANASLSEKRKKKIFDENPRRFYPALATG